MIYYWIMEIQQGNLQHLFHILAALGLYTDWQMQLSTNRGGTVQHCLTNLKTSGGKQVFSVQSSISDGCLRVRSSYKPGGSRSYSLRCLWTHHVVIPNFTHRAQTSVRSVVWSRRVLYKYLDKKAHCLISLCYNYLALEMTQWLWGWSAEAFIWRCFLNNEIPSRNIPSFLPSCLDSETLWDRMTDRWVKESRAGGGAP